QRGPTCTPKGDRGLSCFRLGHENLCEHSLHLHEGLDTGATASLTGTLPHSLPSTPDIENAELTPILPFLYLGNEHDAQDINLLQRLNIGYILNVTTHLPLYHYDTGLFIYKRLPATDSNKQNLVQHNSKSYGQILMKFSGFVGNGPPRGPPHPRSPPKFNHFFLIPFPTNPENFIQICP
uniref:Uncharacterized protein n=1 Tax=Sphaeramia orbicularis TaxID=375764 RepID=A0A673BBL3_9TELE